MAAILTQGMLLFLRACWTGINHTGHAQLKRTLGNAVSFSTAVCPDKDLMTT